MHVGATVALTTCKFRGAQPELVFKVKPQTTVLIIITLLLIGSFAHAQKAKRFGFGAKLCIHPKQIPIIKRAFSPTIEEISWAKRVIAADNASNGQAVKVDGKMVDRPVVMLAHRILRLAGNP